MFNIVNDSNYVLNKRASINLIDEAKLSGSLYEEKKKIELL